ncbi:hypothetical protein [Zavarzinia sp.]|uniref:hypothetical protein n=1 Tax=Zavarzinia sp. TaxID=2027920 RepID=UPI003BB5F6B0
MRIMILVAAIGLTGCAGTEMGATVMERSGDMHVFEADGPDHDYKFYIKNIADVGFDGDRAADRHLLMQKYLAGECRGVTIVREDYLRLGRWLTGSPKGQWIERVKCER